MEDTPSFVLATNMSPSDPEDTELDSEAEKRKYCQTAFYEKLLGLRPRREPRKMARRQSRYGHSSPTRKAGRRTHKRRKYKIQEYDNGNKIVVTRDHAGLDAAIPQQQQPGTQRLDETPTAVSPVNFRV